MGPLCSGQQSRLCRLLAPLPLEAAAAHAWRPFQFSFKLHEAFRAGQNAAGRLLGESWPEGLSVEQLLFAWRGGEPK